MDTLSTVSGHPEYISEIDFSPVQARYIRFGATDGDDRYAASEVQVFGVSVCPSHPPVALMAAGFAGLALRAAGCASS